MSLKKYEKHILAKMEVEIVDGIHQLEAFALMTESKEKEELAKILFEVMAVAGIVHRGKSDNSLSPDLLTMAQTIWNGFQEHANNPYFTTLIQDEVDKIPEAEKERMREMIKNKFKQ